MTNLFYHRSRITLFLIVAFATFSSAQVQDFIEQTDQFLQQYVKDGQVDYKKIKENPSQLDQLTATLKNSSLSKETVTSKKAFWINAYNISVIQSVIQDYPIRSPKEINGFFDQAKHAIAGFELTLNELEQKQLLDIDQDARLHFVLVCAAKDCPLLQNRAYQVSTLEQQIETQVKNTLNDPNFIRIDNSKNIVYLSEIFNWYEKDFKSAGGVLAFINKYRTTKIPAHYKAKQYTYNWLLNEQSEQTAQFTFEHYQASKLLIKKQVEIKLFNALYTQRSLDGFDRPNSRSSYFSSFYQYLYGYNAKLNVGFDVVFKSNLVNDLDERSPFNVLRFQSNSHFQLQACTESHNISEHSDCATNITTAQDTLRRATGEPLQTTSAIGLSHVGPKIKFIPFKRWKDISLQQTLYIPIQKRVDGQLISFTQFFYDRPVGKSSQFFIEASLWMPIRPQLRPQPFFKFFYSYFPVKNWTLYGMYSLPHEFGIGTKYMLTKNLEIEFLYTYFLPIKTFVGENLPTTFNLGFRYSR